MAIGTSPNPLIKSTTTGLEVNRHGGIVVQEETGATSRAGVFAGGDAVTGAATVIPAMGAGKTAARAIDAYLNPAASPYRANHLKGVCIWRRQYIEGAVQGVPYDEYITLINEVFGFDGVGRISARCCPSCIARAHAAERELCGGRGRRLRGGSRRVQP